MEGRLIISYPFALKKHKREKSFKLVNEKKKEGKKLKVGFIGTAFLPNVESAKIICSRHCAKVEGIAKFLYMWQWI